MQAISDTLGGHDSTAAQRELTQHLTAVPYESAVEEIHATRLICEAIKALPAWATTPCSIGHICAVLSAKVGASGWSHLEYAEDAQSVLDDLHDDLTYSERG